MSTTSEPANEARVPAYRVAINGWTRLAIACRTVPGTFQDGGQSPDRPATTFLGDQGCPLIQLG